MTTGELRAELEHQWPSYKFGDGLLVAICKRFERFDERIVAKAMERHRLESLDATKPVWSVVEKLCCGGRGESADNYWTQRVRFERSAKGRTWRDGMGDEEMIVAGLRQTRELLGDVWVSSECRALRDGLRSMGSPVPDFIADRAACKAEAAPEPTPKPTPHEAAMELYKPVEVPDSSIPF